MRERGTVGLKSLLGSNDMSRGSPSVLFGCSESHSICTESGMKLECLITENEHLTTGKMQHERMFICGQVKMLSDRVVRSGEVQRDKPTLVVGLVIAVARIRVPLRHRTMNRRNRRWSSRDGVSVAGAK